MWAARQQSADASQRRPGGVAERTETAGLAFLILLLQGRASQAGVIPAAWCFLF